MNKTSLLFPLHGFIYWNGGIDLARVLSSALMHPSIESKFQLSFAAPKVPLVEGLLQHALRYWRVRRSGAREEAKSGGLTKLQLATSDIARAHPLFPCAANGAGILQAANTASADIIFPTMLPLGGSRIPRVAYLFDFQHQYLPDLFSARARRRRSSQFERLALDCNSVMVTSRSVANDASTFLNIARDRIFALPYTPFALPWWFDASPQETMQNYGIGAPYILICNHFWKHKDHETALRAFALLLDSSETAHRDLQLVMTGDPVDHRAPEHYGRLLKLADQLGIKKRTRFLGLIPKRDQLALIRGCLALLQPTLFEGGPGGGSVYEAIGLGTPVVVSDIPVNLEIDQGNARFFRTNNPGDLAEKVKEVLIDQTPRPSCDDLLKRGDENLAHLGQAIATHLLRIANSK